MQSLEIRKRFLKFFEERGHSIIPSASLVPADDPTVLFTTAGMHPLVPYLLGQKHPAGERLVNYQKCIRTQDIDEVGDKTHDTFFEMLGNWSLGNYFKKEAIEWSWQFLTDKKTGLGINPDRIAVSCFVGDKEMGVPKDREAAGLWQKHGIPKSRIVYLGVDDNWWGPPGETGPCGPDTEMFVWNDLTAEPPTEFDPENEGWVEVWNNVFMQYNKTASGNFEPLKQKNVDTGMGLERISMVMQKTDNIYETDLFAPVITKVRNQGKQPNLKAERIITDHIRAAVMLSGDGVRASNLDRGYVLRRLIRRAIRYGKLICAPNGFLPQIAESVIDLFREVYPNLVDVRGEIISSLQAEAEKFEKSLQRGIREFEKLVRQDHVRELITGPEAFELFSTYGFPLELTVEMAGEQDIGVDERGFWQEFEKHQKKSRTATSGTFKGGLADHGEQTVKLHTATHLLQAALRKVLGEHVYQKGSNITKERTRFDFRHSEKMTSEEIASVEKLVNDWIARDLSVKKEIMPLTKARELGAIGLFGEKYGSDVSVYTIYDPKTDEVISREFCGGPHVTHTGEIGKFKITKEQSAAAGVRRIKAVVE